MFAVLNFSRRRLLIAALVSGTGLSSAALAGDGRLIVDPDSPYLFSDTDQAAADPNSNVVLRGSVGYASITAREHVYAGSSGDDNLSLLVWESQAPIANVDVKLRLPDGWTLRGHIDAALLGDSVMTDYDWTSFSPSYQFNDWDHRSISPNTSLDWYLKGDIALGRDLPISEALTVNVNGGLSYTDVEWTAVGGTYVYSVGGFRDTVGTIPNVPAVRYRQQLPTIFAGLDATVSDGPWDLEAGARAGLIVYGQSVDHHYLRTPPEYITDNLTFGQMVSAEAKIEYNFTDHLGAYLSGAYDKMFAGHMPTDYRQISDGSLILHDDSIGGAELDAWSVTAGVKGRF